MERLYGSAKPPDSGVDAKRSSLKRGTRTPYCAKRNTENIFKSWIQERKK